MLAWRNRICIRRNNFCAVAMVAVQLLIYELVYDTGSCSQYKLDGADIRAFVCHMWVDFYSNRDAVVA